MFNKLSLLVAKGLLTVLPFVLTIYLIGWVATSAESLLSPYIPYEYYFPGLGVVVIVLILAFVGIIVNAYLIKKIINYGKQLLETVPVVKTVFGAIQDAVHLFEVKKEQANKKPVTVEVSPGVSLIGFITSSDIAKLLFPNDQKIAVYLPLSYQIGGYTLYLSPNKVTELDIDVETAMRIAVTGGSSIKASKTP